MDKEKIKLIKELLDKCDKRDCECCCDFLDERPYECLKKLHKQALTLINELESELEKEQINNLNCDTELQYKEKRIAELEKENATKTDTITDLLKKQEFYETEKLKKFTERLKEEFIKSANIQDSITAKKLFRDICPIKVDKVLKKTLKECLND